MRWEDGLASREDTTCEKERRREKKKKKKKKTVGVTRRHSPLHPASKHSCQRLVLDAHELEPGLFALVLGVRAVFIPYLGELTPIVTTATVQVCNQIDGREARGRRHLCVFSQEKMRFSQAT